MYLSATNLPQLHVKFKTDLQSQHVMFDFLDFMDLKSTNFYCMFQT